MDNISKNIFLYTLPPVVSIETVESIAAELKQWLLEDRSVVTIDASQLESITTPGLQLLVSLEKTLTSQGGTLTLSGKRESFINALSDTGLASLAS